MEHAYLCATVNCRSVQSDSAPMSHRVGFLGEGTYDLLDINLHDNSVLCGMIITSLKLLTLGIATTALPNGLALVWVFQNSERQCTNASYIYSSFSSRSY